MCRTSSGRGRGRGRGGRGRGRGGRGRGRGSRNEYYLGGIITLLLQDHRTVSIK